MTRVGAMRAWRAAAAAAAVLVLAGCAAPTEPDPDALPAGVTVSLTQQRSDVAERQAQVRVSNGSDAVVTVGAVSVSDPRWTGPATRVVQRRSTLAPGAEVNVRVQLAPVRCAAGGEATAVVSLEYEMDGRAGTAVAPVEEVFPFLAALHERECVEQRARQTAAIGFAGFTPSEAGAPASLELAISPVSEAHDLVVVGIRETNLLTFEGYDPAAGSYPLGIGLTGMGRSGAAASLPLIPARCDSHAVQEDKRGTVFGLLVEVDGVAGRFDLVADPELRGRILSWVAHWCGYGSR